MTGTAERGGWRGRLLLLSGLVPLLGLFARPPDVMLLIYTVFVATYAMRGRLRAWTERLPGPATLHLVALFVLSGTLTESLAWLSNYLKAAPDPALFHPQLGADLIIGFGFYGGWAVAWRIALQRFRYTLVEAFVITGVQGIFFEQLGAVFLAMLAAAPTNPAGSLLFGVYVFAVHGSAAGLALVPVLHRFDAPGRSERWLRYPAAVALMVGCAFVGAWLAAVATLPFGGLPPKQSIAAHPFW